MKLWEVDTRILNALSLADESGELPPEAEALLDSLTIERMDKVTAIVAVIRNSKACALAAHAEKKRLEEIEQRHTKTAERLKAYLLQSMKTLGETKLFCGPLGSPRIQKNSAPSVKFAGDVHELAGRWKRITVELDKQAVVAAFKAGEQLPDGVACEYGDHLAGLG